MVFYLTAKYLQESLSILVHVVPLLQVPLYVLNFDISIFISLVQNGVFLHYVLLSLIQPLLHVC